jgi:hypothetical protein
MNKPLPWKENRAGAVSLIYDGLDDATWQWVIAHHADVGIRGCAPPPLAPGIHAELTRKNWDVSARGFVNTDSLLPHLGGTWPDPIPYAATTDLHSLQSRVEEAMSRNLGIVFKWDLPQLTALGATTHHALLRWLGDHHARIWCAPLSNLESYFHNYIPAENRAG